MENNQYHKRCKRALWLPEGSIRGILAIMVAITICYGMVVKIDFPDWFIVIVTMVFTLYFKKEYLKIKGGDQ